MDDSKNETELELLEKGYKKYSGKDTTIFYNKEICKHIGNCVRGNPRVFEVGRRPWINPDKGLTREIYDVVDTCPSGALKYINKEKRISMEIKEEIGRFALYDLGKEIGEMTWSNAGEEIMIIDHTYVDPAYRGHGLAEKLVELGVKKARKEQKKIIPLCPFAKKILNEKISYSDVLRK